MFMHRYSWISQFFPCFKVEYAHLYWIFFPQHTDKQVAAVPAKMLQLDLFCHFGNKIISPLV